MKCPSFYLQKPLLSIFIFFSLIWLTEWVTDTDFIQSTFFSQLLHLRNAKYTRILLPVRNLKYVFLPVSITVWILIIFLPSSIKKWKHFHHSWCVSEEGFFAVTADEGWRFFYIKIFSWIKQYSFWPKQLSIIQCILTSLHYHHSIRSCNLYAKYVYEREIIVKTICHVKSLRWINGSL